MTLLNLSDLPPGRSGAASVMPTKGDRVDRWTAALFALCFPEGRRVARSFRALAGYDPALDHYQQALRVLSASARERAGTLPVGELVESIAEFDTLRVGALRGRGPETVDALLLGNGRPAVSIWRLAEYARSLTAPAIASLLAHPALRFALVANAELERLEALP